MDPSHDAQDRARGSERYHTCADGQGAWTGARMAKRNTIFLHCLGPSWVKTRSRSNGLMSAYAGCRHSCHISLVSVGQKPTYAVRQIALSFDHLVRDGEHRRRHLDAERSGCLNVDGE